MEVPFKRNIEASPYIRGQSANLQNFSFGKGIDVYYGPILNIICIRY